MIEGTYRFYQNGELVCSSKNLITTAGGVAIRKYLAGKVGSIAAAIAVGVGSNAPAVGDTRLTFEVGRAIVDVKSVDEVTSDIIFKGTIPQFDQYTIHEIGIWNLFTDPLAGENGGRPITLFNSFEGWTNSTVTTANARTSADAIVVSPAANATVSTRSDVSALDLSGYSVNDVFTLAFYKPNNNINALALVFENSSTGAKYSLSKSVAALPIGYNVVSYRKGDFVLTGTLDWAGITRFGVDAASGATGGSITLDGIRLEDADITDTDYALVSRSVLATPLVKTNSTPMDVEYALRFTIG